MKWSKSHIFTLKESPADAEIPSHSLMVRAGLIRKLAPGIYIYGNLALRAIRKFENIVREELNRRGCVEILMPVVHPQALWEETGRWKDMGDGLLKFKNRNNHGFCLGATHEEAVTDYVRRDVKSYRDLPVNLYQIQTKYRDEIRPRFGLMRGREFTMKDGYSFDLDKDGAQRSYEQMYQAYEKIFQRLGLKFVIVQADSGNIGGNQSHEFQVLAENGEDALMVSEDARYAANLEVAPVSPPPSAPPASALPREDFATPGLRTIADLSKATGVREDKLVKTMFFSASDDVKELKPIAVLLRGCDEVNPVKVKNMLGLANPPPLLTDEEVKNLTGASPGSCGPVGLKIPIYCEQGIAPLSNFIVGANRDDFHIKNVNFTHDFTHQGFFDLRFAREGDQCPAGGTYKAFRGIEVGHVFYLGTKYSKSMGASYLDINGKATTIEMGCYGIGITRTVQAAIEQSHDKDGIIWPLSIAPFQVHISHLDPGDAKVDGFVQGLYAELIAAGVEVLLDDREERPGVKFKDADLLGFPLRVTVGKRGVESGEIELVERATKETKKVPTTQAVQAIKEWLAARK